MDEASLRRSVCGSRKFFERCPVADCHQTPVGVYQALSLQYMQRVRDARATGRYHDSQKLMRDVDVVAIDTVVDHQDPPSESRIDVVHCI